MKTILTASIALVGFFVWLGCGHTERTTQKPYEPKQYVQRTVSNAPEDLTVPWAYDPGPSDTPMGKELIDIVAEQPNMPGISFEIAGKQIFRPAFGPTLWRMIHKPNSLKMLFIGQDGTHIAEAAGRTATAGFGGRAQDMAAYFGIDTGAAFINTYAFTIAKQYGAYKSPILSEENGKKIVRFGNFVENGQWMISQDQNSPMVKWRNKLIDWIMRNNRDSLRMVVVFGGSAQDSIATFIESRGGKVKSIYSSEDIKNKNIKIPQLKIMPAVANAVFPVIVDKEGKDLYSKLAGRSLDYKKESDQKIATDLLAKNIESVYKDLVLTNNGLSQSGLIHPAQINGFDLNNIEINGKKTLSLKGLQLSDGSRFENDVLVAEFPHPTFLSKSEETKPGSASVKIAESLVNILPYKKAGWKIEPDPGKINNFDKGNPYKYGRTDLSQAYYDFGTPNNRMVSRSDAARMKNPNRNEKKSYAHVVILGERDPVSFNMKAIDEATAALPNEPISNEELFTARPRIEKDRYVFDPGPGEVMAAIMKKNIDMNAIGALKEGFTLKAKPKRNETAEEIADVDGFNIKTHPIAVGDFGHYRGTFNNPRVVILADPAGFDEILTSRAMTGTRGQYLQGLMNLLGVREQHLVIRTVPFGMDNATKQEWSTVLEQTRGYRTEIFKEILNNGAPDLVIADGPYAIKEVSRLIKKNIPVVNIVRTGIDDGSGINESIKEINKLKIFEKISEPVKMANIPRSHLGFMSRVWEGTSGTRVFNTTSPAKNGIAFAVVVPAWAFNQKNVKQNAEERSGIEKIKETFQEQRIPLFQERKKQIEEQDDAQEGATFFFQGRFNEQDLAA